jgi:hypothetical protein
LPSARGSNYTFDGVWMGVEGVGRGGESSARRWSTVATWRRRCSGCAWGWTPAWVTSSIAWRCVCACACVCVWVCVCVRVYERRQRNLTRRLVSGRASAAGSGRAQPAPPPAAACGSPTYSLKEVHTAVGRHHPSAFLCWVVLSYGREVSSPSIRRIRRISSLVESVAEK